MSNPWEKYKQKLGNSRPWDALNAENYTDAETAMNRMRICLDCPKLLKITKQCKECGCFMNLKTRLTNATCPLGKW